MPIIRFEYTPEVFIHPKTEKVAYQYRPFIEVRLCYKYHLNKYLVKCLLDSGADRNLFPAEWGKTVRINIEKGEKVKHYGIGDKDLIAFRHIIKLYIGSYSFNTSADFSYEQKFPLLGREDFFKYFKQIVFFEKEHLVRLKY